VNEDHFAARLRELRERAGWTQDQLADRAGMTREGVAQLEISRRAPAWKSVLALANALGVGVEAFTAPPSERPAPGRGRPAKAREEAPPAAKRPRGRPRKDAGKVRDKQK
jgi:transcriptional regulator with XRE-family HTH domain